uniref:Small ribosomal subunit protein uS3c n=1 Tax=Monotropsis odorata TaxID=176252 RepID=A0A221SR39_9ERIC|nr:ribosomal protein S3 [Monotropsis odorata]ASN79006.1 ribosomal protein S3 [Monotropsis odorata]
MGQKVNPLGFRLGTTQAHYSIWFVHPKSYSKDLEEDKKIRDYIQNYFKKKKKNIKNIKSFSSFSGISCIEIKKRIDFIHVILYLGFQKFLNESSIKELDINLQKEFNSGNRKINIFTILNPNPYRNPLILAQYIAGQLKDRVPVQKAMKKAIEKIKKMNTKGIKIQIAGRLDGQNIACVEWISKGRIPLQTIREKIDYCSYPVKTIYGMLGIKIWIFIDNKYK